MKDKDEINTLHSRAAAMGTGADAGAAQPLDGRAGRESGVTSVTLRAWRKAARAQRDVTPGNDKLSDRWSSADKFRMVLRTAPLSEAECAEYCRTRAIHPEQLQQWRQACEQANAAGTQQFLQAGRMLSTTTLRHIRDLESDPCCRPSP